MVQAMGSFARIADEGEGDEVSGVHARSFEPRDGVERATSERGRTERLGGRCERERARAGLVG